MKHELRLFLIAVQFLTRIPVRIPGEFHADWLNQSARYFPAVGSLLGVAAALVFVGANAWLGAGPAAWLTIGATVFITGAFHEDGFADTCDGLGGAVSRSRALEIMKDSRIGAYGAVGLVVLLGLKASILAALPVRNGVAALVLGHTASRAAAMSLTWRLSYAGDLEHAKTKPLARLRGWSLFITLFWVIAVSAALVMFEPQWWLRVACSLAAASAVALVCARWFLRRLGGFTGDTLGAAQQVCEAAIWLAWLASQ